MENELAKILVIGNEDAFQLLAQIEDSGVRDGGTFFGDVKNVEIGAAKSKNDSALNAFIRQKLHL